MCGVMPLFRADRGQRFFAQYLCAELSVCFCMLRSLSICVGCVWRCPPVPDSCVQHWVWTSKAQLELRELLAKGRAGLCQQQVRTIVPGVCVPVLPEEKCIRENPGMKAEVVSAPSGDMFFSIGQSIAKTTACFIA